MFKDKKVLCLICARGGSKGVPGKNIRLLGEMPLIGWSINSAKQSSYFDRIIVSTDSQEIADTATRYDAEVPFIRPESLAMDDSPEWLVWQHAIGELKRRDNFDPDYTVCLPPTSPFRKLEDIDNCLNLLHKDDADIVISVSESGRNPYFNMVEFDSDKYVHLSKKPDTKITRRQETPPAYDISTAVYAARTSFVLNATGIFDGKVKAIVVPENRALDIDTELDFKFAEFLINNGLIQQSIR